MASLKTFIDMERGRLFVDHCGEKFGRLTVVEYAGRWGSYKRKWKCLCECGGFTIQQLTTLARGRSSCGGCGRDRTPVQHVNPTDKQLHDFWRKVTKQSEGECWLWAGRKNKGGSGYGQVCLDGKYTGAHRFSWMIHNGSIPDGLFVLHKCDNPGCVNPSHLFLGTHDDNMADKVFKHRQPKGDLHPLRLHPEKCSRGIAHGNAKLDDEKVRAIKRRRTSGEAFASIAIAFAVSKASIMNVCNGRTWAHVV